MRLSPEQTRTIKTTIECMLDPSARIWLFGSRVHDDRRGGDVDLYVETTSQGLLRELRCKARLEEALDLHIDLIVKKSGQDHPIYRIARTEGIRL